jgi:hypothetical protein
MVLVSNAEAGDDRMLAGDGDDAARKIQAVTRDDLVRFARRDWAAVARAKERHWLRQRQSATYADLLRRSDDLRRHARAVAPDGPSSAVRHADIAVHERVGKALRAVARATC